MTRSGKSDYHITPLVIDCTSFFPPPTTTLSSFSKSLKSIELLGALQVRFCKHYCAFFVFERSTMNHHWAPRSSSPLPLSPRFVKRTGSQVGEYELCHRLAEGKFGIVFLGLQTTTMKQVAMKFVPLDLARGESEEVGLGRAMNEVEIMRQLSDSPYIVGLRDILEVKGGLPPRSRSAREVESTFTYICLVMDYIPGGDLCDFLIKHGPIPEVLAREILVEIILGLQHCHERNVFHRDIKPDNILLDFELHPRLCDFGLSSVVPPKSLITTYVGSTQYLAPEVLLGVPHEGGRADVWSLGVVLYMMLTAKFPWAGASWREQKSRALRGECEEAHLLPQGVRDLLSQMLDTNPMSRATMQQVWSHPWIAGECLPQTPLSCNSSSSDIQAFSDLSYAQSGSTVYPFVPIHTTERDVHQELAQLPETVLRFHSEESIVRMLEDMDDSSLNLDTEDEHEETEEEEEEPSEEDWARYSCHFAIDV